MKKKDVVVGGLYTAKVSGNLTTVRVDRIWERTGYNGRSSTTYGVTNMKTMRTCMFRSASKFRSPAAVNPNNDVSINAVAADNFLAAAAKAAECQANIGKMASELPK